MARKAVTEKVHKKWTTRHEDPICVQVWKYDTRINPNGPVSVETRWKDQDLLDQWENARIKEGGRGE